MKDWKNIWPRLCCKVHIIKGKTRVGGCWTTEEIANEQKAEYEKMGFKVEIERR